LIPLGLKWDVCCPLSIIARSRYRRLMPPHPPTGASPDGVEWAERRLVDGLVAGSSEAVSEFLSRTHHPLFCMACRLTTDPDLRRDWSHEVLLGILDDVNRGRFVYRRPGSFWAWFRKRAYYRLLNEYSRHRRRLRREPSGDIEHTQAAEESSPWATTVSLENEVESVRMRAAVEACLERIPSRDQQRALALLLFEDLAYQEIAQVLATPLNTIKAWVRRGRLALRICLSAALGLETPGRSGGAMAEARAEREDGP